jgi:hypothetical protein
LKTGATDGPDRNRVFGMSMALAWNIKAGHIVSMVGTQHFSLSQASPIINEMVWDKVQEQMTEMRAQIKEEIKLAVEQENRRKYL